MYSADRRKNPFFCWGWGWCFFSFFYRAGVAVGDELPFKVIE